MLPLDNSLFARVLQPRPSATAGKSVFTYKGEISGIPTNNAPNIINRMMKITRLVVGVSMASKGVKGMLMALVCLTVD